MHIINPTNGIYVKHRINPIPNERYHMISISAISLIIVETNPINKIHSNGIWNTMIDKITG